MMSAQESWRFHYRKNRYLRHLRDDELHQRGGEVLNANLSLTDEAKIGFLNQKEFGSEAIERWTHYLEECSLRGFDHMHAMKGLSLKDVTPHLPGDNGRRAAQATRESRTANRGQLFKFGMAKYLLPLLNEGALRIQSASSFSSPKHNAAVGDIETARSFKVAARTTDLLRRVNREALTRGLGENVQVEFTVSSFTDYWMTCFSKSLQLRMAVDFEADSMLVVHNAEEFRRRLRKSVRGATDYSKMGDGPVKYFDPYLPKCDIWNIPLIKPFKFYYQHEFRYFWLPTEPMNQLGYIEVKMGALNDICELVTW